MKLPHGEAEPTGAPRRQIPWPAVALLTGLIVALSLVPSSPAFGRTWHVALDGSRDVPAIQEALASSVSGDTILVHPGRYVENIDFLGKAVLLKSTDGPDFTIIDGSSADSSTVVFKRNEPREAIVEGFTITGGRGTLLRGSLAYARADTRSPSTIESTFGGGILCTEGSPTIRGNHILGNHAGWGGGVHIGHLTGDRQSSGAPLLSNNLISDNLADGNGGGARIVSSMAHLEDNTLEHNHAMYDGGGADIRLDTGSVIIEHNVFHDNLAGDHGGGLHACTIVWGAPVPQIRVSHCLFDHNLAMGSGSGETGAGGGISVIDFIGSIVSNTIVDNQASGEVSCSGGGINVFNMDDVLTTIEENIIAFNVGCGISCRATGTGTLGPNILWSNGGGDIGASPESCPASWAGAAVLTDPQFCDREGGVYTISTTSPAVTETVKFGAFTDPACPGTPVVSTTWGAIKALYR